MGQVQARGRRKARTSRGTVLLFSAAAALSSCSGASNGGPDAGGDTFDRRALFQNLGANVILPTYRDFAAKALSLEQAAAAWEGALGTSNEATAREAAQQAWRGAMSVWQRAELMQVGPAGAMGTFTGGMTLRDEIYSWPVVSTCRVDQELVAGNFGTPDFFKNALVNVYGLDALEYLLFYAAEQNTCAPQSSINASGQWAALGAAEIRRRRADYAHAVAAQLRTVAEDLVNRWDPANGNFVSELATAGTAESIYETERMAADELFAAMFYLDLVTKDLKLAVPAGISPTCTSDTCPESVESLWASYSKEELHANVEGFRALLTGNEGVGFDDWLVARSATDLATQLVTETDAALAAVDAIPGTLESALASDPESVRAAHAAVKRVSDLMKSQFVTVLNLSVPDEGAADND